VDLKAEIRIPKIQTVVIRNEREVIARAAAKIAADVRARARAGTGVDGPLKSPKRGGSPFNSTGALIASIGFVMKTDAKGRVRAIVRPLGPRKHETIRSADGAEAEWRKQIRRETNRRRALAVKDMISVRAASTFGKTAVKYAKKRARKSDAVKKLRYHPVDTQASLAAVLSMKDKRAGHTSRLVHVVIATTKIEADDAQRIVRELARPELITVGETVLRR